MRVYEHARRMFVVLEVGMSHAFGCKVKQAIENTLQVATKRGRRRKTKLTVFHKLLKKLA